MAKEEIRSITFSRRLSDGSLFRLGTAVRMVGGWKFISGVAAHRNSRKLHPTFGACVPRWVGYPNKCESEFNMDSLP